MSHVVSICVRARQLCNGVERGKDQRRCSGSNVDTTVHEVGGIAKTQTRIGVAEALCTASTRMTERGWVRAHGTVWRPVEEKSHGLPPVQTRAVFPSTPLLSDTSAKRFWLNGTW